MEYSNFNDNQKNFVDDVLTQLKIDSNNWSRKPNQSEFDDIYASHDLWSDKDFSQQEIDQATDCIEHTVSVYRQQQSQKAVEQAYKIKQFFESKESEDEQ